MRYSDQNYLSAYRLFARELNLVTRNDNTSEHFTGDAFDSSFRYFFPDKKAGFLHGFSLDLEFIYKAKGFHQEEIEMNEHFGIRFGTTKGM